MIQTKSVFVVGAGASNDLGLPIGSELKVRIANILRKNSVNEPLMGALNDRAFKTKIPISDYLNMANFIAENMDKAESIDNFLNNHRDNEELVYVGKLAIAYCISTAEANCPISEDRPGASITTDDYFLVELLRIVVRGHTVKDVEKSLQNLHFITFNYDRCIERYLDIWLSQNFGQSMSQFVSDNVKFLHVYGSLGDYFAEGKFSLKSSESRRFFLNPQIELPKIAERLKIFTESTTIDVNENIRWFMSDAKLVTFLGFGFEEQNMSIFEGLEFENMPKVFATTFNVSDPNVKLIRSELGQKFRKHNGATTYDSKCAELFRYHGSDIKSAVRSYSPT